MSATRVAGRRAAPSGRAAARHAPPLARVAPIVAVAALVWLGGCTSAVKRECLEGDWERIGYRDGRAGLGFERVGERAERCSDYDVRVDSAAWNAGHERGIAEYCAPANGFDLGEADEAYSGGCPTALEGRFLASYVRGLGIRRDALQLGYDRLRGELGRAQRERAALAPDEDADGLDERIESLEGRLEENLERRRRINARIARWSRDL